MYSYYTVNSRYYLLKNKASQIEKLLELDYGIFRKPPTLNAMKLILLQ